MRAVVLEKKGEIKIRDIEIEESLSPDDVRIRPVSVGICGSDIHYYTEGNIGNFVVREPMVLGHEASGVIIETGTNVKHLKVGDRVCVEPGIPNFKSNETLKGKYNLDPDVKFWATPPIHGCLRETVVVPASFTHKLADNITFHEGALVEPVAIGVYSVGKARLSPGDIVLIIGAGTIGIVTALAACAAGCSKIYLADIKKEKLDFVEMHYGDMIETIDLNNQNIADAFEKAGIRGADVVFEASGSEKVYKNIAETLVPSGVLVLIGMPINSVELDIVSLQVKEISIETIFRYANIFPKVINLIASGKLNVAPLVTKKFYFEDSLKAFEYIAGFPGSDVKIMIDMDSDRNGDDLLKKEKL